MKGWRTFVVNGLVLLIAALQSAEVIALIPPEHLPTALAVAAMANVALRTITNTAPGKSE